MQEFTILVAHDVPHYGTVDIEARNADHALEILKARHFTARRFECIMHSVSSDLENTACARVVHILDEHGNASHEGTPLTDRTDTGAVADLLESAALLLDDYLDRVAAPGTRDRIVLEAARDIAQALELLQHS